MSCVINIHGQYVLVSAPLLVVGVIEHRGRCSPKGEGSVKNLVKNSCKTNIRPRSWDMYSKLNGGKKHPSGCSFRLLWLKENGKGKINGFGKA